MKALSIKNPFASLILHGYKPIEIRSWKTNLRGELLICIALKDAPLSAVNINATTLTRHYWPEDFITGEGCAVCVATLTNCRPMVIEDCAKAFIPESAFRPGLWAWELTNIRPIKPFRVKGKQGLFEVEQLYDLIKVIA